ncbi:MAG: DUF4105 domain-containing protein [Psychrobacter pacificensis]|uniref:Lnb N-terminal periplasmic domain-containing protein n=1 Tax=Psychrobacter pacificensis TaxID=112002 RepID=UPI0023A40DBE|nr:DUF4105 domain-containing protein [Psychrobacter pacificensis]MDE0843186.1 DUF4105 domain-containing protein [Psychrobacter pacificensis]
MSLRSVFYRLLSSRSRSQLADSHSVSRDLDNRSADNKPPRPTWRHRLVIFLIAITILLSAIWLLLAIWYQYGISSVLTWLATLIIVGILAALLSMRYWHTVTKILLSDSLSNKKSIHKNTATRYLIGLYGATWLIGLGWFFSIEPQQDRDWMAEVDQQVAYERDATNPDLITLTNVRNFDWRTDEDATEHWETRTIDLSKLSGVDVTNSYWMGPLIAHTLVSFRFEDDRPLAFSFEIRKENGESFSALAGFFRRYELSLIAAEERDIIYTRSNARGEQVYLFPISNLQQHEVRSLFESYLTAMDELNTKPAWYNTLTSNCTNIIFYMARIVSGERLPWDYRIWVSGWLPNYLYDVGMLDAAPEKQNQPWSMDTWYERTHINPKSSGFNNLHSIANSREFSRQIRQDIPIPPLADSQSSAEAKAKSTAQASH